MTDEKLTVEDKVTIKELEEKIAGMKEDKEKKCKAAKEQLVSMLEVTVDKYRTATGTAEALRVLRFTSEEKPDGRHWIINDAVNLAHTMAEVTSEMHSKAKKLNYAEMDKLCEGFYAEDFKIEKGKSPYIQLAEQMMRIDLCRNVGGAAEDMVEFIKRVEEDIDATGRQLKELKAKEK